ncbi:hypothetical protein ZWY2020_026482 [Hordeum vulgare]|nr:hypothetical protein ZWY2020_026482 [Hordeum vulgare]
MDVRLREQGEGHIRCRRDGRAWRAVPQTGSPEGVVVHVGAERRARMSGHRRCAAGQRRGEAGRPRALRARPGGRRPQHGAAARGAGSGWRGQAGPATACRGRARPRPDTPMARRRDGR